ncbi:MAG: MerR family transcriptional regulator [Candidatus Omnitrophica bacterium]|nr:MerR family transcriptional regulator [Candidatus Omnitrophota bacterium]MCA9415735.1 MerR family transcriptional regulator [Candidatus Omnitrophota bacterium]MCA9423890.1 MerR family transcriptional regulator [Candidatus Omnitrophota bacterium]MCA9429300.1 MerR family transcriptional regulator [Candidatus Omnitrophota bacterium]MCA9434948.1 MerR family transcriptional regulator [Candidatus Omnitrophota bacterium]
MVRMRGDIPDKIYYSISEVSEYTGVEPHVLRYWETKFSKLRPKRVGGNQRKYSRSDLEIIFQIIDLLYEQGFTLEGAEKKLTTGGGQPEVDTTPEGLQREISLVKRELEGILEIMGSETDSPVAQEG